MHPGTLAKFPHKVSRDKETKDLIHLCVSSIPVGPYSVFSEITIGLFIEILRGYESFGINNLYNYMNIFGIHANSESSKSQDQTSPNFNLQPDSMDACVLSSDLG